MSANTAQIQELGEVFASLPNHEQAIAFLHDILTPAEFEEVVLRLQIFKQLKAGTPQRDIATNLNVSVGKISRGSRTLKYEASDFLKGLWWSDSNSHPAS